MSVCVRFSLPSAQLHLLAFSLFSSVIISSLSCVDTYLYVDLKYFEFFLQFALFLRKMNVLYRAEIDSQ